MVTAVVGHLINMTLAMMSYLTHASRWSRILDPWLGLMPRRCWWYRR